MSDPFPFPSTSPHIGLPLLIAGQAQKEFFVNQALSILDALDRRAVVASLASPPIDASDGDCYRVTASATQQWAGKEDQLAIRVAGAWHFVPPRQGMRMFDSNADQCLFYQAGWRIAASPVVPTAGTVIDLEARAALGQLIQTLRETGILGAATG